MLVGILVPLNRAEKDCDKSWLCVPRFVLIITSGILESLESGLKLGRDSPHSLLVPIVYNYY